jgi:hypothetical protein
MSRDGLATTASSHRPDQDSVPQERWRWRRELRSGRLHPGRRESSWHLLQRRLEQLIRGAAATLAEQ